MAYFRKKIIERVRAIIIYSDKILLINRVKDGASYWVVPGGRVEQNESHEYAIKRECLEELGVKIRVREFFLKSIAEKPGMEGQYEFFYLCDVIDGEVGTGQGPEFQSGTQYAGEYRISWVDLNMLPRLNLKPEKVREKIIRDYLFA